MSREQEKVPSEILWNIRQLKHAVGLSERTLWRLNDSGKLPLAIRVGRAVRWRKTDILTWIEWNCCSRQEFTARKAVG